MILDSNDTDSLFRISLLLASYLELCEKRGLKFVENSQQKTAIQHIIHVLQPPTMKTRKECTLQLERADINDDYFAFVDFLAEKAVIFEEVIPLREYL